MIFISGGVRSGKSSFAENLAYSYITEKRNKLIYIATSKSEDSEMAGRIKKHQQDRKESGYCWETWECETHLEKKISLFSEEQIVVIDCLTILVANELFIDENKWSDHSFQHEIIKRINYFIDQLCEKQITTIIVSNEILNGSLSYDKATLTYMKMIGELHQQIVKLANEAYLVEAGIPIKMKGCE